MTNHNPLARWLARGASVLFVVSAVTCPTLSAHAAGTKETGLKQELPLTVGISAVSTSDGDKQLKQRPAGTAKLQLLTPVEAKQSEEKAAARKAPVAAPQAAISSPLDPGTPAPKDEAVSAAKPDAKIAAIEAEVTGSITSENKPEAKAEVTVPAEAAAVEEAASVSERAPSVSNTPEQDKFADMPPAEAPLQMYVSIDDQKIYVYRGTDLIESAPISTGRRGHSTPTGVFSILEKRRKHFSNLYDSAPMPYMQRLTWSGIALHQGRLPGYPASHGCIRMPKAFAQSLFKITDRGMHVLVTKKAVTPHLVYSDVLPQPMPLGTEVASLSSETISADPALRGALQSASVDPQVGTERETPFFDQPLRMIITPRPAENQRMVLQDLLNRSGFDAGVVDGILGRKTRAAIEQYQLKAELEVDGKMTPELLQRLKQETNYVEPANGILRIRRKFKDIYEAPVTLKDPDAPLGTTVFTALGFHDGQHKVQWMAAPAEEDEVATPEAVLGRIEMPEQVRRQVSAMLTPGTSLIVTDRSFKRNTGLGTDFVVITR